jgi:hypothetical protein
MSATNSPQAAKPIRLSVPGVLDILLVSDPAQIQFLNQHVDVVRPLDPTASWLHKILDGRLRHDLDFGGPLPVFLPRKNEARADRQLQLAKDLEDMRGAPGLDRDEIGDYISGKRPLTEIGAAVERWYHKLLSIKPRAHEDEDDIGVIVQRWCGHLFSAYYKSDRESYEAGKLLAGWASAPPWQTIADRLTGKLTRAKQKLSSAAQNDRHCIHATSIGMENVAKTVRNLRQTAQHGDTTNLSPDDALRACLAAPPAVLRGVAADVNAPFLDKPLTKRSLVVFLVARAFRASGEIDVAFLAGGWSACPAHEVIPEMLRGVWHAAHHESDVEKTLSLLGTNAWSRLFHRAAS